jgi:amphi-Trp domain-containing protein
MRVRCDTEATMSKHAESHPAKEKMKIRATETLDLESALAHLENILGGMKHGGLRLRSDDNFVDLVPGKTVEVEVSAKQKKGMQHLSLEMTWPFDPSTVSSESEPEAVAPGGEDYGSSIDAPAAESLATIAEGKTCVADRLRDLNKEIEDEEYCAERRFELEFLGGCDCYEVPPC